jgi:hypothetical protein
LTVRDGAVHPYDQLLGIRDDDGVGPPGEGPGAHAVERWRRVIAPPIDGFAWASLEPDGALGVPRQQCLERLVCGALAEAWPDRAVAVHRWVSGVQSSGHAGSEAPAGLSPKACVWTWMAGWWAEKECDEFYAAIWREPAVKMGLRRRLDALGALRLLAGLGG